MNDPKDDKGLLQGWSAICEYLGLDRKTILRRGYPVYAIPFTRVIWAEKALLNAHTRALYRNSTALPGPRLEEEN